MTQLSISLSEAERSDDEAARRLREVYRSLRGVEGVETTMASRPAAAGEKADVVTLNEVLVNIVSSGALLAVVETVRAVVKKSSGFTYKIKNTKTGKEEEISGEDLDHEAVEQILTKIVDSRDRS